MVKKYRKKPVVIESIQFIPENDREIHEWLSCKHNFGLNLADTPYLKIQTLEGDMIVSRKDWIIKGINGEFYPCKPDIFEQTYEEIEE